MSDPLGVKPSFDTSDFKTGIAQMNQSLRVLDSAFKADSAALGDWSASATGLEIRSKSLSAQIDIQKQKVAALEAEHKRLVEAQGADSTAAQNMEIKLNLATAALNKMDNELTGTVSALATMNSAEQDAANSSGELGQATKQTAQATESASGATISFSDVLGGLVTAAKVSVAALAAMIGIVIALAGAISGLVLSTTNASAELTDMSVKTGISTTALQEYNYIANQTGTSLDTITGAQAKLVKSMSGAQDEQAKYNDAVLAMKPGDKIPELGATGAAFATLGVQVKDAGGHLRNADDVFREAIDALGKVQNPAERDALAMQIFGKSAQELNPLIKAGSVEMARLAQEANQVGAVMSEKDVAAGAAFQDTLDSLKDGLKGVAGTIGALFLPAFQGMASTAQDYLGQFVSVIKGANGDVGKIADGAGEIFTRIVGKIAEGAPQMMQAGLGIIQTIIKSLVAAMPTLLPAAVGILTSLVTFLVQSLPMLFQSGVTIIMGLINALLPQLPLIFAAALQILISLVQGITAALPTLIPVIVDVMLQIVQVLVDNLPLLIDASLQLIVALATGLIAALPVLLEQLPKIIEGILNALTAALPMLAKVAVQLIVMLAMGIISAMPQLLTAVGQILKSIYDTLSPGAVMSLMGQIAQGIIDGLIAGWNSAWQNFITAVGNGFSDLIAFIKGLLGIASPSKLTMGIGANMGKGLGIGLLGAIDDVAKQLPGALGGLTLAMSGAGAGIGGLGGGNGAQRNYTDNSNTYYGPVYNIASAGNAASPKAKRF